MGKIRPLIILATFACPLEAGCSASTTTPQSAIVKQLLTPSIMQIISPAFGYNQGIPTKYTCDGNSLNPPLEISGIPSGAASLVLIIDDPDAPSGDFVHWVVINIPTDTVGISEGKTPKGIVARNTLGTNEYVSPCPPTGTHRYFFRLYALDVVLRLDATAVKADVLKAMDGHILSQTELVGLYELKNRPTEV